MSSENEFIEFLPTKSKVAYGSANTASNILSGIGFAAITFYYNVKLGLSAELIGIAWLIFAIWNAINDPFLDILKIELKQDGDAEFHIFDLVHLYIVYSLY